MGKKLVRKRKNIFIFLGLVLILVLGAFYFMQFPVKILIAENFPKQALGIKEFCLQNKDWRRCFGEQLAAFNKDHALKETLVILKEIQKIEPKVNDCHFIAHFISSSEVEKAPDKWLDVFNLVDQTTCNNGYIHGVMEGRARFDPDFEIKASVIPATCQAIEERINQRLGKTNGSDDACAHIMGHILLAEVGGNVDKAVQECSGVEKTYKISCYQGIFMENILRENLIVHEVAKPLPKTDDSARQIASICPTFEVDARGACYRELSHIYTLITNDPQRVYKYCQASPNKDEARECYFHALNLMVLSDKASDNDLAVYCQNFKGDDKNIKSCISRIIQPILGSSLSLITEASAFCQVQEGIYRDYCFQRIGQKLKNVKDRAKVRELCQEVPQQFKDICLGSY
ncbi:MAG: hypothetical protein ACD_30C00054G0027 [uncultured bacterium]|uniref:Uncharacterized protein n=2 Tax=Candidatus Daviesiibacteriota TaxID=1752718 RepID=A0A0G0ERW1_9BACT|nr:MAG: hypothetical protein ACD_30C00054G0027 [uncultured bacterium]KKQ08242.1 MAG: hypothetical protein US19_C0029G0013 [Candidatus Daviesbacteria bacterium GW2011_GWB1_36_5]OGE36377.1 MAG: hypothetical protein A3E66_05795 [Candidatus Daviesbacteria bacterium RIFCSPHIGHO2_12_FULL_37_16]